MLQLELQKRGVAKEWIQQALEEEYEQENEQEQILKWIRKKDYSSDTANLKEKQRMYQFLLRRGFRPNDILHALDFEFPL